VETYTSTLELKFRLVLKKKTNASSLSLDVMKDKQNIFLTEIHGIAGDINT